ncbi:MAG: hypothetical protein HC836_31105 [Richelia sp. RM2_1_2]|nr:hypothetical protein [Richelia sp. RM2_1_2]
MFRLDDLQKLNKQELEETYDIHFSIDDYLEKELDEIVTLANQIEAKYRAIHYTKRIVKDA